MSQTIEGTATARLRSTERGIPEHVVHRLSREWVHRSLPEQAKPAQIRKRTERKTTLALQKERLERRRRAEATNSKDIYATEYGQSFLPESKGFAVRTKKIPSTSFEFGTGELRATTESRDQFPGHRAIPPRAKAKVEYRPNNVKLDTKTANRESFQSTPGAQRPERFVPKQRLARTQIPIESTTEARSQFDIKTGKKSDAFCPPETVLHQQRFIGQGTYSSDFGIVKACGQAQPTKRPQTAHHSRAKQSALPGAQGTKFSALSTYADDTDGMLQALAEMKDEPTRPHTTANMRRTRDPLLGDAKATLNSVYATEAQAQFNGSLDNRSIFREKPVSARVGSAIEIGKGEFRATTETRDQFPGHHAQPPVQRKTITYRPNPAKFDSQTTSRQAFTGAALKDHQQPHRPKSKIFQTSSPFTFTTEAREQFQTFKNVRKSDPFKPPQTVMHQSKFFGTSENAQQFVPHRLSTSRLARQGQHVRDIPFIDLGTAYRDGSGAVIEDDLASIDSRGYVY